MLDMTGRFDARAQTILENQQPFLKVARRVLQAQLLLDNVKVLVTPDGFIVCGAVAKRVVGEGRRLARELSDIGFIVRGKAFDVDDVDGSSWAHRWPRSHHQPRPNHAVQRMDPACEPGATGCLLQRTSLLAWQRP